MMASRQATAIRSAKRAAVAGTQIHRKLSEFAAQARRRGNAVTRAALLMGTKAQTDNAVSLLAQDMDLEVLRVDLSQVISKFIGETEKNLDAVFRRAEEGGALLLLDEADALFRKRTDVRDSGDRFATAAADAVLERIERFPGMAVLSSRKGNLDPPFTRRFGLVLKLPPAKSAVA